MPDPELVVLDEPSTGVDPVSRVDLWRLLSAAAAGGSAVLVTTTYLDEAERAATVLVLDRGVAVYRGDPAAAATQVRGSIAVRRVGAGGGGGASPAESAVGTTTGGPREHAVVAAGAGAPALAQWRRGGAVHALVPPGEGAPPADLEDAVIALTVERRGGAGTAVAQPEPAVPASARHRAATAAPAAPAVDAAHVVTAFGAFRAVDDVSLTVRPGQVLGLLGANGAGKTTLIRTVLGLLAPTTGTVRVLGGEPSRDTRRRIGYVPQGLGLAADLTVAENLAFVAAAYGLDVVPEPPADLAAQRDRLVGSLSLGLQRRLAFAAALSHGPELLVLDEPTSGVDPLARAALWDTVHEQAEAGVAVLVTTHYMQEAEQCDALVLMSRGRRAAAGTLADVLDGTTAVEVSTPDWQAAFGALSAAGLPVTVAGRAVRVAGAGAADVHRVLGAAGVRGEARSVPARLEEVLTLASR
nr:ATP-binding cassette domain-containing protein [Cellulomonas hominis]